MKSYSLKTALVAIACVGCVTLIAFSTPPLLYVPSSSLPTGWHWIGEGVWCDRPVVDCRGPWALADNWMWHSVNNSPQPPWDYPQDVTDDAYIAWSRETPLVVELSTEPTERIDFLEVKGTPYIAPTQSVTFESISPEGNTLECNHMTFKAIDGTLFVTVKDNATVKTVD